MIESINLRFLPMLGFYQTAKNILDQIADISFTEEGLEQLLTDMNNAFHDLDGVVRRTQGSLHTETLTNLDEGRDALLTGLGGVLRSYLFINIAAQRDAARQLLAYYDTYGDRVARLPQAEETAAITNLIQDFNRPEGQQALGVLPFLNSWIEQLQEINQQFESLFNTRDADTTIPEAGLPKKYRDVLQNVFNSFKRRVNAAIEMSNGANATAQQAAEVVNAAVQSARQRYRAGNSGPGGQ